MEVFTLLATVCLVSFIALVKYVIEKFDVYIPRDLDEIFVKLEAFNTTDFVKIRVFHKKVIFLNKPGLIHKVLSSDVCLEKPQMAYKLICLNKGLLVSTGDRF